MITYLDGKLAHKDPAYVILDVGGVGYEVRISLQTYAALPEGERCKLHTHLSIREDAHTLFGFAEPDEKRLFLDLTGVSGIGPNTALVMLSSLSAAEIRQAIVSEDLGTIQRIKGIGVKTAQRVILELKDKIRKESYLTAATGGFNIPVTPNNSVRQEALSALVTLGIARNAAEKSIDAIMKREGNEITVEQLIKLALR
ncbi:MAG: Holliday junction branch migration protein RuvA [Ferruginibacter sp.]|nr:Holliday junction branch migration protein RuvA [Cytophagales bacterium]